MPWRVTDTMLEKTRFVLAVEAGESTFAELCEASGISRECGYRWWRRFQAEGLAGLNERSRRPQRSPSATSNEVVELLLEARQKKPTRSASKLLDRLRKQRPEIDWPSDTTGYRILKRHGLIAATHRRRSSSAWPGAGGPFVPALAPNDVWTIDFKGHFRLGNRQWCYPLTIQDLYSRYALECRALASTKSTPTRAALVDTFRRYGLPERIRSDNGTPFASHALLGLSQLSIWFLKLGVGIERIEPGKPQQNGQHERYHRTLKAEATQPAEATLQAQQRRFDAFRQEYNEERSHQSLHRAVPADYYQPSPRAYPRRTEWPGLDYPERWQRRQVRNNGEIKWRGITIFISQVLAGEPVALEEVGSVAVVRFGPLHLGLIREDNTFMPA